MKSKMNLRLTTNATIFTFFLCCCFHTTSIASESKPQGGGSPGPDCLAARSTEETAGVTCVTQGVYEFGSFNGTQINNLPGLEIQLQKLTGEVAYDLKNPTVFTENGAPSVVFSSNEQKVVEFHGVKIFPNRAPNFGFSVVTGRSGNCIAFRSGTPRNCLAVIKPQISGNSDSFRLPEIPVPSQPIEFLYDKVPVIKVNGSSPRYYAPRVSYTDAQASCKKIGARLPTNREFSLEIERLTWVDSIRGTKYPQVNIPYSSSSPDSIADPGLKQEAADYKAKSFAIAAKSDGSRHWVIDFYFKRTGWIQNAIAASIRKAQSLDAYLDIQDFFTQSPSIYDGNHFVFSATSDFHDQYDGANSNYICVRNK